MNVNRQPLYRRQSRRIDLVIEARRKTHGAEHTQFVLGKAAFGLADGAHDSGLQIVAPADKIQNLVCRRIEHHAVDREIPALHVFTGIFSKANLVGMTAIGVAHIRAKSRDLDDGGVTGEGARRSTGERGRGAVVLERHEHHPELLPDGESLREDLHDLPRSSVGRNVVVGRLAAKQQVADTSAGEVGPVSALAQRENDFRRELFSVRHR